MRKLKEENRRNIRNLFAEKTGVGIKNEDRRRVSAKALCAVAAAACLVILPAFAYSKFSGLDGDDLALGSVYLGDGIVAVTVTNYSDRNLVFEEQLKVMQWKDAVEIAGDGEKIRYENLEVPPHATTVMRIDLSEAYDIFRLEQPLESGNWYYLVLTNNNFALGQDWMCDVDFDKQGLEPLPAIKRPVMDKAEEPLTADALLYEDWIWPTESHVISSAFGENPLNGHFSDHINIMGEKGDSVYAVTEAVVVETGFMAEAGNYCVIEDSAGSRICYGHLKTVLVKEQQKVSQGEQLGTLGKSGMATGYNLSLTVYVDGKAVDPLEKLGTDQP